MAFFVPGEVRCDSGTGSSRLTASLTRGGRDLRRDTRDPVPGARGARRHSCDGRDREQLAPVVCDSGVIVPNIPVQTAVGIPGKGRCTPIPINKRIRFDDAII